MNTENRISTTKNILLILSKEENSFYDLAYLIDNFCGIVVHSLIDFKNSFTNQQIYICGDVSTLNETIDFFYVIKELSIQYDDENTQNHQIISLGKVPILLHKVGIYYRDLFEAHNHFHKIESEHEFQELTESNKPSKALRKGIYLTNISKEKTEDQNDAFHFHLLRCSSNLTGPTDNFRSADNFIVNTLNNAVEHTFEQDIKFNHVLAQIYENHKKNDGSNKELKAKIKAHSDKTKDMPTKGLIAFCTFYDQATFKHLSPSKTNRFDWIYKKNSGFTKLYFKLKPSVIDENLVKEFSVTLFPNSAFIIPLSTNRLYTHETRPSMLSIDQIPIRMGYVARCSKLEAVYMDETTYIKENNELLKLEEMTNENMSTLKDSYFEENSTKNMVKYGKTHFSMNSGDYKKPIY